MGTFSPLGTAFGIRAITQTDNPALLQVISVFGPYAVAFLIGWFATTVNAMWAAGAVKPVGRATATFAAAFAVIYLAGAARLAYAPNPTSYVSVAGVTPSRQVQEAATSSLGATPRSAEEFASIDPVRVSAAFDLVIDDLIASTHEAAQAGAQLIVWSETAASATDATRNALIDRASATARAESVYINVAVGEPFARNETYLIGPDGQVLWQYAKNHPVPILEPVPPTANPAPTVETPFGVITNVICFDADFPALTRVQADIMMVPGVDWPGIGRTHTLKMASLRAIENGYSLVRVAFFSQSAAFDRYGRILATQNTTSPESHIMYADVPTEGARTIYNMIGDVLAWFSVLAVVLAIGFALFARRAASN
jgi:apolipoprotein N-acyltransferase